MNDILQQILSFFGHGFCHQYAERSFEAAGLCFSVCARCTGIYLGFIVTLVLVVLFSMIARKRERVSGQSDAYRQKQDPPIKAGMPQVWAIVVGVLLIVPMAIDGVGSYISLYETSNLVRFSTGYLCGMGVAVIASGGIMSLWPHINQSQSAIISPRSLLALLVASAALGALYYETYPSMGALAPFIVLASHWFTVTVVLLLIVSASRFWSPSATTARRVLIVALCLLAALVVLAVFSLLANLIGTLFPWYVHL